MTSRLSALKGKFRREAKDKKETEETTEADIDQHIEESQSEFVNTTEASGSSADARVEEEIVTEESEVSPPPSSDKSSRLSRLSIFKPKLPSKPKFTFKRKSKGKPEDEGGFQGHGVEVEPETEMSNVSRTSEDYDEGPPTPQAQVTGAQVHAAFGPSHTSAVITGGGGGWGRRNQGTFPMQDDPRSEAIAMDTFRQRIQNVRDSSNLGPQIAPGFDYVNWKSYGVVRYQHNHDEFAQVSKALAPYVRSAVVSGCEGVAERRWLAMTQSPDTHNNTTQNSMTNSGTTSRA